MTRRLLASLLILWDMLDDSLAGPKVWGSNPCLGNQNLQKNINGLRVGRHIVTRPRVDAGGGLRSDKMV